MAENTKIEWCDYTFNPWIGCTKVSPGCANCYAKTQNEFRKWNPNGWGKGKPRKRTSIANWKLPLKWDKEAAKNNTRPRVFCASLADWLDDEVPIEWLADLMRLIAEAPNLDWLLLTKRPQNFHARIRAAFMETACGSLDADNMMSEWVDGNPPHNVWVGTTVEDQQRAEERIPLLLKIPARIRFLSCEPLLGPVDLGMGFPKWRSLNNFNSRIHWVICGGESGPNSAPMHPEWARSLRDQCLNAEIPFLFKQWGEWCPRGPESFGYPSVEGVPRFRMTDTGEDGHRLDASGDNHVHMNRAGKKKSGRLLDGSEWNEFPIGD